MEALGNIFPKNARQTDVKRDEEREKFSRDISELNSSSVNNENFKKSKVSSGMEEEIKVVLSVNLEGKTKESDISKRKCKAGKEKEMETTDPHLRMVENLQKQTELIIGDLQRSTETTLGNIRAIAIVINENLQIMTIEALRNFHLDAEKYVNNFIVDIEIKIRNPILESPVKESSSINNTAHKKWNQSISPTKAFPSHLLPVESTSDSTKLAVNDERKKIRLESSSLYKATLKDDSLTETANLPETSTNHLQKKVELECCSTDKVITSHTSQVQVIKKDIQIGFSAAVENLAQKMSQAIDHLWKSANISNGNLRNHSSVVLLHLRVNTVAAIEKLRSEIEEEINMLRKKHAFQNERITIAIDEINKITQKLMHDLQPVTELAVSHLEEEIDEAIRNLQNDTEMWVEHLRSELDSLIQNLKKEMNLRNEKLKIQSEIPTNHLQLEIRNLMENLRIETDIMVNTFQTELEMAIENIQQETNLAIETAQTRTDVAIEKIRYEIEDVFGYLASNT